MAFTGYGQQQRYQNQNNRYGQQQRYQNQTNRYGQQQQGYPPTIVATAANESAPYHLSLNDENDPNKMNYSKNQQDS